MKQIAELFFEARMLKSIPRSGYQFLGTGKESVAEHCYMTSFIAFTMAQMEPKADPLKLANMCLIHDLAEARTGDLNTVNKLYVTANEDAALSDTIKNLPFGDQMAKLIQEFNDGETLEARLAKDADQLAFIIDLKALKDLGSPVCEKWLPPILQRLTTEIGKKMAQAILDTDQDSWWLKNCVD